MPCRGESVRRWHLLLWIDGFKDICQQNSVALLWTLKGGLQCLLRCCRWNLWWLVQNLRWHTNDVVRIAAYVWETFWFTLREGCFLQLACPLELLIPAIITFTWFSLEHHYSSFCSTHAAHPFQSDVLVYRIKFLVTKDSSSTLVIPLCCFPGSL